MTLATYPHCTYTGDSVVDTGSVFEILSVEYTGADANPYTLGASGTGSITDAQNYLNANLSTYAPWTFNEGELPSIILSENQIENLTVEVDSTPTIILFTQSDCAELPLQSALSSTGSTEFFTEDNLFQASLIEVWISGIVLLFLCMYLLVTKGVPWAR